MPSLWWCGLARSPTRFYVLGGGSGKSRMAASLLCSRLRRHRHVVSAPVWKRARASSAYYVEPYVTRATAMFASVAVSSGLLPAGRC